MPCGFRESIAGPKGSTPTAILRPSPIEGGAGRADGTRPAGIAFEPPGLMPAQNATRTPPLAVPVRLWSDIIMPSTAPNTDTLRLVR